jgi:hypothetical protein
LPLVPRCDCRPQADVLQRPLRARMEDSKQPLVRASAGQETRQGGLPDVRLQRHTGSSPMDASETAGRRAFRPPGVAGRSATMGGGSHCSRRGWRRRVRAGELPPTLPRLSRLGHALMARAAIVVEQTTGGGGVVQGPGPDEPRTAPAFAKASAGPPSSGRRQARELDANHERQREPRRCIDPLIA